MNMAACQKWKKKLLLRVRRKIDDLIGNAEEAAEIEDDEYTRDYQINHMQEQAKCALKREKLYVRVLSDYAKHQRKVNRAQRWFKMIFFTIVCVAFFAIVLGSILSILMISQKDGIQLGDFAVAVTSVVSLVSVILVLPSKIAEHLFPNQGEKDITGFITQMHQMDTKIMGGSCEDNVQTNSEKRDDEDFLRSELRFMSRKDSCSAKRKVCRLKLKDSVPKSTGEKKEHYSDREPSFPI